MSKFDRDIVAVTRLIILIKWTKHLFNYNLIENNTF